MNVIFKTSKASVQGVLNNSISALKIYEKLPLEAAVSTWGHEIYFEVPVTLKPENATLEVEVGDIAYWPPGRCLCIFLGKTPASIGNKPMPATEVNIVGKVTGDIFALDDVKPGDKITVERA